MINKVATVSTEDSTKRWLAAAVILTLLIIGGVEVNPGPTELAKLEEKLNKIKEMLGKHADDASERLENFDLKWIGLKQDVVICNTHCKKN